MNQIPPALHPFLGPLKDFQRETVDYVFRRMYLDDPPTRRFLVADEVGLGKTLVARGIIARALHHLFDEVERIDLIYVCSNAAIAKQNLNRLNVLGDRGITHATRLTLLPAQLKDFKEERVNLISFTPRTTFDLRSSGGTKPERADLFVMLQGVLELPETGFRNLLQCGASRERWKQYVKDRRKEIDLDRVISGDFIDRITADAALIERIREGCDRFSRYRKRVPQEDRQFAYKLIGELRWRLAHLCIDALEPDLIILDEFQRFRDLLDGESEAAQLAQRLMRYPEARVLLLSATPYRMMTLSDESEEDHYEDFFRTVGFLLGDAEDVRRLREDFRRLRNLLIAPDGIPAVPITHTRDAIQSTLLKVMTRTERIDSATSPDAMLQDTPRRAEIAPPDLRQARLVDRVATLLESPDSIEYWKSAPYLLNLMKQYKLKEDFQDTLDDPPLELVKTLREFPEQLLRRSDIEAYREIDPQNGRLRALFQDTLGAGQWRLLWMPPSLPYWTPQGAFAGNGAPTKALVFSAWNVVPDVIAAVCSYSAERLAMGDSDPFPYSELTDRRKPLLQFRMSEGDPESMTTLGLLYPSVTLAREVDPLGIALDLVDDGPVTIDRVREAVKRILEVRLRESGAWPTEADPVPDLRWHWAAPLLLDRARAPEMSGWIRRRWRGVGPGRKTSDRERESGYAEHVRHFSQCFNDGIELGAAPDDLLDVITDLALGSPAVVALRALYRVVGAERWSEPWLLDGAVEVAEGLRSLFNHPESMLLLRSDETEAPYWRLLLDYSVRGNLQAVLDEYVHVLRESLGLVHHPDPQVVGELADAVLEALQIRTSVLGVDEYVPQKSRSIIREKRFNVRCRFALRFGELVDETDRTLARVSDVRAAFNSPFRPFILASTSIGQEGLDFHTYCHAVYHWNLPSNPVDLEQREGRVHRYKGHAVRKNVALRFGLEGLRDRLRGAKDPWAVLFDLAREERPAGVNDLIPYWIYRIDGGALVERRVPLLPFSREERRLPRLKASLAVYRLAFGQPRQEDLVDYLREVSADARGVVDLEEFRISLKPPSVEVEQEVCEGLVKYLATRRDGAGPARPRTPAQEARKQRFEKILRQRSGLAALGMYEEILKWASGLGLSTWYGSGRKDPSIHVILERETDWYPLFALYAYKAQARIALQLKRMRGPFSDPELRIRLLCRLNELPIQIQLIPEDQIYRYPRVELLQLASEEKRRKFFEIYDWVVSLY